MTYVLSELSETIAGLAQAAAPLLVAIRIGPGQHISGIVWSDDLILTTDRLLPEREGYTLVLSNGMLATARPAHRDPGANLAALRLEQPVEAIAMDASARDAVGSLAVVLSADADGSPMVRLSAIHRKAPVTGHGVVLDLPGNWLTPGSLVIDPLAAVLGMGVDGPDNTAVVMPFRFLARFAEVTGHAGRPAIAQIARPRYAPPRPVVLAPPAVAPPSPGRDSPNPRAVPATHDRRAWRGVALQPITIPEALVARAGQTSGRMVVSVSPGGPADVAGLRVNDVVLSLNGQSTSGANALRGFLDSCRIGSRVEVRLLRDIAVSQVSMIVSEQP